MNTNRTAVVTNKICLDIDNRLKQTKSKKATQTTKRKKSNLIADQNKSS